jgi:hypothetical protein
VSAAQQYTFEARWPIDDTSIGFTALKREGTRDLPNLLHEAGAELLCQPDGLWWRLEADELVASGPAQPWHDCRSDGHTHGQVAA